MWLAEHRPSVSHPQRATPRPLEEGPCRQAPPWAWSLPCAHFLRVFPVPDPREFRVVEVDPGPNPLGAWRPTPTPEQAALCSLWVGRESHSSAWPHGMFWSQLPLGLFPNGVCRLSLSLSPGFQGQVTPLHLPVPPRPVGRKGPGLCHRAGLDAGSATFSRCLVVIVRVPRRAVFTCLFLKPQPPEHLWARGGHLASLCWIHAAVGKRAVILPTSCHG